MLARAMENRGEGVMENRGVAMESRGGESIFWDDYDGD